MIVETKTGKLVNLDRFHYVDKQKSMPNPISGPEDAPTYDVCAYYLTDHVKNVVLTTVSSEEKANQLIEALRDYMIAGEKFFSFQNR